MRELKRCTKATYNDEAEALARMQEIKAEDDGRKKPQRAYLCSRCYGWHLTRMSEDLFKTIYKKNENKHRKKYKQQRDARYIDGKRKLGKDK